MRRKMTRASWGIAPKESPRQLRTEHLTELESYVKEQLALHPEIRSAMLTVAQYWADEADDAVHATVVFSTRETPFWPHRCSWEEEDEDGGPTLSPADQCSSCGDYGWPPFDENGDAIPAFQSCCREDASQESAVAEAYLPYAVVRRGKNDTLETEIVGGPIRAWLDEVPSRGPTPSKSHDPQTAALFDLVYENPDDDTPRVVLADHLLQRGDPLGEYVSLALTRKEVALEREVLDRMSVLELENLPRWLGPLADVAPPERAELSRGFVRTVGVHLPDDATADRVAAAREWGTVERLWFLPQSVQRLSPTMRALRSVGPLDGLGVKQLARVASKLPLERVYVLAQATAVLDELASLELPRLRRLGIAGAPAGLGSTSRLARNPFTGQMVTLSDTRPGHALLGPSVLEPLMRASFWPRLEELVVMSIEPTVVSAWVEHPAPMRPKALTFVGVAPTHEPAGFRLRVAGDSAIVDVPAIGSETTFADIAQMVAALPRSMKVSFASTRWLAPTDEDIGALATASNREIARR